MAKFTAYRVTALPTSNIDEGGIYFLRSGNKITIYVRYNNNWELVGGTGDVEKVNGLTGEVEIDLDFTSGQLKVISSGTGTPITTTSINLDTRYEQLSNKVQNLNSPNSTEYLSTQGVYDALINPREIKTVSTSTYTLLQSDENKTLHFTNLNGCTVTVPSGLTSGLYQGKQMGDGQVEFVGASGVEINTVDGFLLKTAGKNAVWALDWTSSNKYVIYGTLESTGGGDQDLDSVLEKGNISDNLIKLEDPSGFGNLSEYNKANLIFTEGAPNPNITQYGFKRIESSQGSDFLTIWLYDYDNDQMSGRGSFHFPKLSTSSTERTLVTSVGGVVADADGNVPFSIGSGGHELSKTEVEDETSTVFGTISGLRWFQAFTKHIAAWWAGITIAIADVVGLQDELDGKADKTTKIEGAGAIEGGGTLAANRTLDLTQATKDDIAKGVTANGWGNHSSAGYQLVSNIRQNLNSPDATTYPSTQAVHDALLAGIPKEEKITGTRYTNTSASGVLSFDMDSYKVFDLVLTGNTDFQIQNPPTGTETKVIEGLVTGNHGLGLPSDWVPFPNNDDYIGSMANHIVVTFIKSGYGGIFYSLQNIILNE